ncbi:hypothetical protein [Halomonas alkalicola]|uniref:Uncharacterized protein n=1 Tax=Halomonas alkalicola TaxID=1930622 RepID=A0ABY9H4U7_9GAMM|nr:hypothetical protein [Halomonas alkalicola]WLI73419.1 hypothetical protein B6N23_00220 [Halomonas alkalicola]
MNHTRQFVQLLCVDKYRLIGQFIDQMQIDHRSLDRSMPQLHLQEGKRLYLIGGTVAL